jgi:hypothetical protein
MSSDRTLPRHEPVSREQILAGFRGSVRPVRPTLKYLISLAAATVATLLAALAYWSLLAGLGWLTVLSLHLYRRPMWGSALVLSEIVLISLLLKPLFGEPRAGYASIRLDRDRDPLLIDFIGRLCQATGTRQPDEVRLICEPIAAALVSGLLRQTRVLQLGLPLIESMSLQQISGVIAHELGRFGRRAESRLWPLIQRILSWLEGGAQLRQNAERLFALCRATIDQNLLKGTLASLGSLPLGLGLSGVAWLFEALRLFAAAASSTLMRQDTRNADRYLVEVAGSKSVAAILREQAALNQVFLSVRENLRQTWREGRLPEDLPRLMVQLLQHDRVKIERAVTESFLARREGVFGGSPSVEERIGNALAQKAEGIFQSDLPAIVLFRTPEDLGRRVTFNFFKGLFGRQLRRENLLPDDAFLPSEPPEPEASSGRLAMAGRQQLAMPAPPRSPHLDQGIDRGPALKRTFPAVSLLRPLPFLHRLATAPLTADLQQLNAARSALARGLPAYVRQIHHYAQVFDETIELQLSLAFLLNGIALPPTRFSLYSGTLPHLQRDLELALGRLSRTGAVASEFEQLQVRRVTLGLEIWSLRPEMDVATPASGCPSLLAAARMLQQLAPGLEDVERRRRVLSILDQEHIDRPGDRPLRQGVQGEAWQLRSELESLRFMMAAEGPQPELGGMTLVQFCIPYLPEARVVADLSAAAALAVDRFLSIHLRILERLAAIVEQVECDLGLAPIAWPTLPAVTGRGPTLELPGNAPPAA